MTRTYRWILIGLLAMAPLYSQGLEVTLVPERTTYFEGEEIWVEISWENNTPYTLFSGDYNMDRDFYIIGSDGNSVISALSATFHGGRPDFAPNQTLVRNFEFGINLGVYTEEKSALHLPADVYHVYLTGNIRGTPGDANNPRPTYPVTYTSNTVDIVVSKPTGDDSTAWAMLNQAEQYRQVSLYSVGGTDGLLIVDEKVDSIYNAIITNYPQTPYIERTLWKRSTLLKRINIAQRLEESASVLATLIRKFPDSIASGRWMGSLISHPAFQSNPGRLLQILNEIAAAHPNTRAGEAAQRRLESLQSQPGE